MKTIAIKNIATCALVLCAGGTFYAQKPVFAQQPSASASATTATPPLPNTRLAGQARHRVWGFEVYDAALWVAPGFSADAPERQAFALELSYLRDFSARDIASRSIDEMRRSGPLTATQAAGWQQTLATTLPDVRKGDRLTGIHQPGQATVFWLNGKPVGEIAGADFAQRFFGIWLSPQTSAPQLREALLSGVRP